MYLSAMRDASERFTAAPFVARLLNELIGRLDILKIMMVKELRETLFELVKQELVVDMGGGHVEVVRDPGQNEAKETDMGRTRTARQGQEGR